MHYFADRVIVPYISKCGYTRLCEIGASDGQNTQKLLGRDVELTVIDPCIDADLSREFSGKRNITIRRGLSLEILPLINEQFDCILIDGDHNWYTVFNELSIIHDKHLLRDGGSIILHDILWPYGRRDMYYLPESIPSEFRRPYSQRGIVEGEAELSDASSFNSELYNADVEGGPQNGVRTAIEDFLKQHKGAYLFTHLDIQRGIGIIYKKNNHNIKAAYICTSIVNGLINMSLPLVAMLKKRFPQLASSLKRCCN